jgi:nucleotide-binding universal stress UspA family protein
MYERVIIPLDGSKLAEGVLPQVDALIRGRQCQVHLLSVAPTRRGVWPFTDLQPEKKEQQRIREELTAYLRAAAEKMSEVAPADVKFDVRFGRPADEILAFAAEVEADLIATSTHGHSGLRQWVFGSVTDRVLSEAPCPVLLVRPDHPVDSLTSYQRILVPLDGSEMAEQVLPYVKALIEPNRTTLFLISVLVTDVGERTVTLLTSYPPGLQLATTARHHAEMQLRTYLRGMASRLRTHGAIVHTAIRYGAPADEILRYAADVNANLISMTTHGLSGLSRWVYGNVAGQVLHRAQSPVLLVRPDVSVKRKA